MIEKFRYVLLLQKSPKLPLAIVDAHPLAVNVNENCIILESTTIVNCDGRHRGTERIRNLHSAHLW